MRTLDDPTLLVEIKDVVEALGLSDDVKELLVSSVEQRADWFLHWADAHGVEHAIVLELASLRAFRLIDEHNQATPLALGL